MADPILPINEGQSARIRANLQLNEIFGSKNLNQLSFFSDQISAYLIDYFVLVKDLEKEGGEIPRKAYHDYSFVVAPVQKSLEAILKALFEFPFMLPVTKKKGESIGYYLNMPDEKKKELIEKMGKTFSLKISMDKWLEMWSALGKEWETNRNKLTHVDEEKIETMQQAIIAASSIIRWMKVSSDLIMKEFLDPAIEEYRKKKETEKLPAYSPSASSSASLPPLSPPPAESGSRE